MFKLIKRLIKIALVLALAFCALTVYLGFCEYRSALEEKDLTQAVTDVREKENFCPIADLPQTYLDAVVAVEDHRFELHRGIDIIGVARAVFVNIRDRELNEGGSTITQQLAKNLYFMTNRNLVRKIAEGFMAVKIENEYSKNEILELYVNNIYFGDGYYCVYDAAQGYFGKAPKDMTGYECTLLAGIPNAPSVYAPTKNPDLAEQRRQVVLRRMVSHGYLSEEEAGELGINSD